MKALPAIARGERIYAVGDIHGRLDLFAKIVAQIRADAEHAPSRRTRLLLIGDVVDRGPDARGLVEHLMTHSRDPNLIVLRGNHEQMMLTAIAGDVQSLAAWLRFGGDATLRSWGFSEQELAMDPGDLAGILRRRFPQDVLTWIGQLPFSYRSGDFFFTHAGIAPGIPLENQTPASLLWIGDEFLAFEGNHPAVIVHGHTVVETGPEIRRNRIALDTGAYRTNRLSAVCFEGSRQWTIVASIEADARTHSNWLALMTSHRDELGVNLAAILNASAAASKKPRRRLMSVAAVMALVILAFAALVGPLRETQPSGPSRIFVARPDDRTAVANAPAAAYSASAPRPRPAGAAEVAQQSSSLKEADKRPLSRPAQTKVSDKRLLAHNARPRRSTQAAQQSLAPSIRTASVEDYGNDQGAPTARADEKNSRLEALDALRALRLR